MCRSRSTELDLRFTYDEYGNPTATNGLRYGWLGGKIRAQAGVGNLTLMGQRLYDPATGRFLQTDPIPGGSANAYDYTNQDPINRYDLNGQCWGCGMFKKVAKHWRGLVQAAVFVGCIAASPIVRMAAGALSSLATSYNHGGFNWGEAATGAIFSGIGGVAGRAFAGSWTTSALERLGTRELGMGAHLAQGPMSAWNTGLNMSVNGTIGLSSTVGQNYFRQWSNQRAY